MGLSAEVTPPTGGGVLVEVNQPNGFPKGAALATFLDGGVFSLSVARDDVGLVSSPSPYFSPTTAWFLGNPAANGTSGSTYSWTPHFSFDTPVGAATQCGRVHYGDYHGVNIGTGIGFPAECTGTAFTPQEAMLAFMLFDLSSCSGPVGQPTPLCTPLGGACAGQSDCCGGLNCNGTCQ